MPTGGADTHLSHEDYVRAYREGRIDVRVDRKAAARLVSGRMLLPLVVLPVLGLGVAAALIGHLFVGIAVFLGGVALRFAVRASSHGFVLARSLSDPEFYRAALRAGVITILAR